MSLLAQRYDWGVEEGHYGIPASWREMASWFCDFWSVPSNWMLFISWKEALAKGQLSTRCFSIFQTHGDEASPSPHPLMIKWWKEKAGLFQTCPSYIATECVPRVRHTESSETLNNILWWQKSHKKWPAANCKGHMHKKCTCLNFW